MFVNESLLPIELAVKNRTIRNTARGVTSRKLYLSSDRFVSARKEVLCKYARTKDRCRIRNFLMAFSKSYVSHNILYIFIVRRSFILMQYNSRTIVTQLIAKGLSHENWQREFHTFLCRFLTFLCRLIFHFDWIFVHCIVYLRFTSIWHLVLGIACEWLIRYSTKGCVILRRWKRFHSTQENLY